MSAYVPVWVRKPTCMFSKKYVAIHQWCIPSSFQLRPIRALPNQDDEKRWLGKTEPSFLQLDWGVFAVGGLFIKFTFVPLVWIHIGWSLRHGWRHLQAGSPSVESVLCRTLDAPEKRIKRTSNLQVGGQTVGVSHTHKPQLVLLWGARRRAHLHIFTMLTIWFKRENR